MRSAGRQVMTFSSPDFLVHLAGELAVGASEQVLAVVGEVLVAAHEHVEHGLGAHDLAGGGHQGRVAEVLADHGDLRQHVVVLILGAGLLELAHQVAEHAAGHLVDEGVGVHHHGLGGVGALLHHPILDLAEVLGYLGEGRKIEAGVPLGAL